MELSLINRSRDYIVISVLIMLFFIQINNVLAETGKAVITIKSNNIIGPVNKNLFGNNIVAYVKKHYKGLYRDKGAGVWDPERGVPVEGFVSALKDAGTTVLRWPGGNGASYLDWKKTVGPLESRSKQKFGLPEFLKICEKVGAVPILTLPATITENNSADLVEYLNSVNNKKNPNGGVDWAEVRVADGRIEPWNVIWFEFGNETFYTDMTAVDYVKRYANNQKAMKTLDPDIKLGAVLEDNGTIENGWTHTVLNSLRQDIDYVAIHPYIVKLSKVAAENVPKEKVSLAALSADMDLAWRLNRYRKAITNLTGNKNIPITVTEYNGSFVQDKPIPYRHTLLNALHNADTLRVLLDPSYKVKFATYWQFANSYWGMVRGGLGSNVSIVKQPMQYIFEIYHQYLGSKLIEAEIESGTFNFEGMLGISSRKGFKKPAVSGGYLKDLPKTWSRRYFLDGNQEESNGVVRVEFKGDKKVSYHHAFRKIKVEPDTLYIITVKARVKNIADGKVGIAVQETNSSKNKYFQARNTYLSGTTDWRDVTVPFRTSSDAHEIIVLARNFGNGKISGAAEFYNVRIERMQGKFGATPYITAISSTDKNNLYIILMNKNINESIDVEITLNSSISEFYPVHASSVTGKSIYSTNLDDEEVKLANISKDKIIKVEKNKFVTRLAPSSIIGVKFSSN